MEDKVMDNKAKCVYRTTELFRGTYVTDILPMKDFRGKYNSLLFEITAAKNEYDEELILDLHNCNSIIELQNKFWEIGSTPNGVLGVKISYIDNHLKQTVKNLKESIKDKLGQQETNI